MIYIYHCYGGTHSSALAVAYHLNNLPRNRPPTKQEVLETNTFNRLTYRDWGNIIFHGEDGEGNQVYTVARGTCKYLVPSLKDLVEIMQKISGKKEKVVFSNTSPTVPFAMTMGGFFSRGLKLDFIGKPLLVIGAQQMYKDVMRLVEHTREEGRTMKGDILVLENKQFN